MVQTQLKLVSPVAPEQPRATEDLARFAYRYRGVRTPRIKNAEGVTVASAVVDARRAGT